MKFLFHTPSEPMSVVALRSAETPSQQSEKQEKPKEKLQKYMDEYDRIAGEFFDHGLSVPHFEISAIYENKNGSLSKEPSKEKQEPLYKDIVIEYSRSEKSVVFSWWKKNTQGKYEFHLQGYNRGGEKGILDLKAYEKKYRDNKGNLKGDVYTARDQLEYLQTRQDNLEYSKRKKNIWGETKTASESEIRRLRNILQGEKGRMTGFFLEKVSRTSQLEELKYFLKPLEEKLEQRKRQEIVR
ncbi:hypothetical protein K9M59_04595 [Candidatus Gracilibacteria bacterium]|nr:hypothetical protein [Candidatus Gracilibacteria bacterium]MCF7819833.1 hypothetical protein [Candidatus Gracilibacteria bacterium]